MVFITSDEAKLLYRRMKKAGGPTKEQLQLLHLQANYGADDVDKFWKKSYETTKCVFLSDEGACTVYKYRPAACRTFMVTSKPFRCSKVNSEKGDGMVLRHYNLGMEIYATAADNVQDTMTLPEGILMLYQSDRTAKWATDSDKQQNSEKEEFDKIFAEKLKILQEQKAEKERLEQEKKESEAEMNEKEESGKVL
mmetsp:Transcript_22148/g.24736  ORF Transcript_22148/g.24736 Transcript_22148/m.24736 type:complete len:195 (+) Transcript_22148:197-781(+)